MHCRIVQFPQLVGGYLAKGVIVCMFCHVSSSGSNHVLKCYSSNYKLSKNVDIDIYTTTGIYIDTMIPTLQRPDPSSPMRLFSKMAMIVHGPAVDRRDWSWASFGGTREWARRCFHFKSCCWAGRHEADDEKVGYSRQDDQTPFIRLRILILLSAERALEMFASYENNKTLNIIGEQKEIW